MKKILFTKMVAAGNDFVVIDIIAGGKGQGAGMALDEFARSACDRKFGIGADGLIVLERSRKSDFKMRIFNPDGSEPKMCGNGARCAALFFAAHTTKRPLRGPIKFETRAGQMEAEVKKEIVKLKMPDPRDIWPKIDLNLGSQFYKVHYINTGVPHAVFFVSNVDTINIKEVGRQIRFHKQFQPEGTNADVAQIISATVIKVRTYERGVEDETLACGTGSVASALTSYYLKLTNKSPISVQTKSGEVLKVYFDHKNNKFSNVWLEGGAKMVFEGGIYV